MQTVAIYKGFEIKQNLELRRAFARRDLPPARRKLVYRVIGPSRMCAMPFTSETAARDHVDFLIKLDLIDQPEK